MKIYKITNIKNSKIYVGKDTHDDPNYFGSGLLITRAIKKYGKDKFKKEILESCTTLAELDKQELYWIQTLNCLNPNGYNILLGSVGGDTFTNNPNKEIIREKYATAAKMRVGELNTFFSKTHNETTKRKIALANSSREHTMDCQCASCRSKRGEMTNGMQGRHHTEDSIRKMKANRPDYSGDKNPNYKDGKRVKNI